MPAVKLTERAVAGLELPAGKVQQLFYDSELAGFGVLVGRTARTFVVEGRVAGKTRRTKVGRVGAVGPLGEWNLARARKRAKEILVDMANGNDPNAERRAPGGPTLRDGLALHVDKMRKKNRSPRSIHTIETEVPRLLGDWMDRPLVELTGADLDAVCRGIMEDTEPRAGAVNPPGAALAKRLVAQVGAVWRAADKLHELPGRNPATKVETHTLAPRAERVADKEFPAWHAKVQTLSAVRRDLQLFTLFTGLRSESVRTLRHDDVDEKKRVLHVTKTKGDRPYTIPLPKACLDILKRRKKDNAVAFGPHGGDAGWVFPTLSRAKPFRVQPVAEAKERRENDEGERVSYLPGLHALRRTFNSVAMEVGVSKNDREALMNHEGRGVNVKHYGFPQDWSHLAECSRKIERALWARIEGKKAKRG